MGCSFCRACGRVLRALVCMHFLVSSRCCEPLSDRQAAFEVCLATDIFSVCFNGTSETRVSMLFSDVEAEGELFASSSLYGQPRDLKCDPGAKGSHRTWKPKTRQRGMKPAGSTGLTSV